MRNSEEALDMAQEVFCAAYTSMDKFAHKSKFSTWLYRVAVTLCFVGFQSKPGAPNGWKPCMRLCKTIYPVPIWCRILPLLPI